MEEKENKKEVSQEIEAPEILKQLIDAGVHLGRKKSIGHPKMKPYIFTTRQEVQILNVEKIAEKLKESADFLKEIASTGGTILFVSVSMPARNITKKAAEELKMPYVSERWIGGTLTNFGVISKRINYLLKQEERKSKGELSKYTKKEQLDMEQEMKDLEKKIGGIKTLKKHPEVMLVVDAGEHSIAIKEAKKVGVPVVAVANTNADPTELDYSIPANDKSIKSIQFVVSYLKDAISEGLAKPQAKKEEKTENKKETK